MSDTFNLAAAVDLCSAIMGELESGTPTELRDELRKRGAFDAEKADLIIDATLPLWRKTDKGGTQVGRYEARSEVGVKRSAGTDVIETFNDLLNHLGEWRQFPRSSRPSSNGDDRLRDAVYCHARRRGYLLRARNVKQPVIELRLIKLKTFELKAEPEPEPPTEAASNEGSAADR
jgi:hypothetical protein